MHTHGRAVVGERRGLAAALMLDVAQPLRRGVLERRTAAHERRAAGRVGASASVSAQPLLRPSAWRHVARPAARPRPGPRRAELLLHLAPVGQPVLRRTRPVRACGRLGRRGPLGARRVRAFLGTMTTAHIRRPRALSRDTEIAQNMQAIRGAPGRTRTCDPRIRSPTLYPAELRGPSHAAGDAVHAPPHADTTHHADRTPRTGMPTAGCRAADPVSRQGRPCAEAPRCR